MSCAVCVCAVCCVLCAMCCVLCVVCCVLCAVCCVLCAVCLPLTAPPYPPLSLPSPYRALTISKARKVKADANAEYYKERRCKEDDAAVEAEKKRLVAATKLEAELREVRERKKSEQAALEAEQLRVARQQAYLGAASGAVQENRAHELLLAKVRYCLCLTIHPKHI